MVWGSLGGSNNKDDDNNESNDDNDHSNKKLRSLVATASSSRPNQSQSSFGHRNRRLQRIARKLLLPFNDRSGAACAADAPGVQGLRDLWEARPARRRLSISFPRFVDVCFVELADTCRQMFLALSPTNPKP